MFRGRVTASLGAPDPSTSVRPVCDRGPSLGITVAWTLSYSLHSLFRLLRAAASKLTPGALFNQIRLLP